MTDVQYKTRQKIKERTERKAKNIGSTTDARVTVCGFIDTAMLRRCCAGAAFDSASIQFKDLCFAYSLAGWLAGSLVDYDEPIGL